MRVKLLTAILLMGIVGTIVGTIGIAPSAWGTSYITVTGIATSSSSIDITWTDADTTSVITDYIVQTSGDNGITWQTFNDGIGTDKRATIPDLQPGLVYFVKVTAVINGVMSDHYSHTGIATKPLAPTNVQGNIDVISRTLNMTWGIPANTPRDSFKVVEHKSTGDIIHTTTNMGLNFDVSTYLDDQIVRTTVYTIKHNVDSAGTAFDVRVCGLDPTPHGEKRLPNRIC